MSQTQAFTALTDRLVAAPADGALDCATIPLEHHRSSRGLAAELLRQHLWITALESSPRNISGRIPATVGTFDPKLAPDLTTGRPSQSDAAVGPATTVAELVFGLAYENDADNMPAVRGTGRLLQDRPTPPGTARARGVFGFSGSDSATDVPSWPLVQRLFGMAHTVSNALTPNEQCLTHPPTKET